MAEKKTTAKLYTGTGRRKTSVARVFLYADKGDITVNGVEIDTYFTTESDKIRWAKPFHLVGIAHPKAKFSSTIRVMGGGKSSQLGAIVHGLARALCSSNPEYRQILRKQGLLTRDPRMVERKKYYLHKARKAPQYSKR